MVLGTSAGSFLFARWKGEPLVMGGMLLGIAALGSCFSLFIRRVPASGSSRPMRWNPFAEIWAGTLRIYHESLLRLTGAGISHFWFLGALFQMTVILVGIESLHLSDTRTGLLVTALAVGIGAGSVAAGWLSSGHVEVGLLPWDPNLPIRGRYLALVLTPDGDSPYYQRMNHERVVFFVTEHQTELDSLTFRRNAPDLWVEVTIPRKGPPRPIRMGFNKGGQFKAVDSN